MTPRSGMGLPQHGLPQHGLPQHGLPQQGLTQRYQLTPKPTL